MSEENTPTITPSRQEIASQLKLPEYSRDEGIIAEANRRFNTTLDYVHAVAFLSGVQEPPLNVPCPDDWPEHEFYDPRYEHDEWMYRTEAVSEALRDPYVSNFLRKAVALRIHMYSQLDQYRIDTQKFSPDDADHITNALEYKYSSKISSVYQSLKEKFHQSSYAEYYEDEGDYLDYPYINEINFDQYLRLADKIATECASNSYLEEMFQLFCSPGELSSVEVQYQERAEKLVAEKIIPPEVDPYLLAMELQIKDHIANIYSQEHLDFPPVTYVDKKGIEVLKTILNTTQLGDGGYIHAIKYGNVEVPLNLCFVRIKKNRPLVLTADTIFEELYHASGGQIAKIDKGNYSWPGWKGGHTGSFFEEGLMGVEKLLFFKERQGAEYFAEGTPASNVLHYVRGEPTQGEVEDIWSAVLMRGIIKHCEEDGFTEKLRKARCNDQLALQQIETTIDAKFGAGTFDYLGKLDGHNRNAIKHALIKLNLVQDGDLGRAILDFYEVE